MARLHARCKRQALNALNECNAEASRTIRTNIYTTAYSCTLIQVRRSLDTQINDSTHSRVFYGAP
jgi:hypothetical protein